MSRFKLFEEFNSETKTVSIYYTDEQVVEFLNHISNEITKEIGVKWHIDNTERITCAFLQSQKKKVIETLKRDSLEIDIGPGIGGRTNFYIREVDHDKDIDDFLKNHRGLLKGKKFGI